MLDRESKRERILEGKLREIRIKIKKEQEEAAKAAQQAALAAEMKDEMPTLKPSNSESEQLETIVDECSVIAFVLVLIDSAEMEFNDAVEEELQRRIKEEEEDHSQAQEKKSHKPRKKREGENGDSKDTDVDDELDDLPVTNGHSNGTSNGHHHENGNGNAK